MREKERENKINDIIDKIAVVFNDLEHKDDEQNAQLLSEVINDLKKLISGYKVCNYMGDRGLKK